MRSFVRAIAAFGAMVFCGPAQALILITPHTAEALYYCRGDRIYSPDSRDAPDVIARSFAGRGQVLTFRICRDWDGNVHYFIRKPRPNRDGVCRILEAEVFPGRDSDSTDVDVLDDGTAPGWSFALAGWNYRPPAPWIAMGYFPQHGILALVTSPKAACPRGDNAGYIAVSATDGMLKTFFGIWRGATASQDSFDKFFAGVTVLPVPMLHDDDIARTLPGLKKAVFDRHEDIQRIDCDTSEFGTRTGCIAWIDVYSLQFDVTDHGLVITGVRENPLI